MLACLHSHKPLDLVVIALGVNDLKVQYGATPAGIADGAGHLADLVRTAEVGSMDPATGLPVAPPKVLLVSPAPVSVLNDTCLAWGFRDGIARSTALAAEFERVVSERRARGASEDDIDMLDAGALITCSTLDGIHLDAAAHEKLGEALARKMAAMLKLGS